MPRAKAVRGPYVIDELVLKRAMGTSGRGYWFVHTRCPFLEGVWHELRSLANDEGQFRTNPPEAKTKVHIKGRIFRWRGRQA